MSDEGPISVVHTPVAHVVALHGELDLATSGATGQAVLEATADAPAVVVDLSDVSYLDSAGMRLLDRVARVLGHRGVPLRIVAPAGGRPRFVLTLCAFRPGLLALDVEEGLASLAAPGSEPAGG